MLIYMFLSPGYVPANEQLYPGQGVVQAFLLTLALICIPWLLCLNPFLEWREHRQKVNRGYRQASSDEDGDGDITRPEDELYDEEFGQHAMHPGEKEVGAPVLAPFFSALRALPNAGRIRDGGRYHSPSHTYHRVRLIAISCALASDI
jgi:hypothetical protein